MRWVLVFNQSGQRHGSISLMRSGVCKRSRPGVGVYVPEKKMRGALASRRRTPTAGDLSFLYVKTSIA
jgi:hypothetical protein